MGTLTTRSDAHQSRAPKQPLRLNGMMRDARLTLNRVRLSHIADLSTRPIDLLRVMSSLTIENVRIAVQDSSWGTLHNNHTFVLSSITVKSFG